MADPDNPGQFGNRDDTEEQARAGGEADSDNLDATDDNEEFEDTTPIESADTDEEDGDVDDDEDMGDGEQSDDEVVA